MTESGAGTGALRANKNLALAAMMFAVAMTFTLAHPGRRAPAAPTSPATEQAAEEPAA